MNEWLVNDFFEENFATIETTLTAYGAKPMGPMMAKHTLIKYVEEENTRPVTEEYKTVLPFLAVKRMIEIHDMCSKKKLFITYELFELISTVEEYIEFMGTTEGLKFDGKNLIQVLMEDDNDD